jgi:hypothetical protein
VPLILTCFKGLFPGVFEHERLLAQHKEVCVMGWRRRSGNMIALKAKGRERGREREREGDREGDRLLQLACFVLSQPWQVGPSRLGKMVCCI